MTWVLTKILFVLALVLANAFFVAVEFALVTIKRSRILAMSEAGDSRAKAVLRALNRLDEMLSASQFGITLASLALGAVGESTLAHLIEPYFLRFFDSGIAPWISHSVALTIALAIITFLHLVLGEYAPKAFAIEKAEAVSLATARWMELFYITFKPFIKLINISGIKFLKLFGVNFRPGHHSIYTEEEIRDLINLSHKSGYLDQDEKTLIHNIFEFNDLMAHQIMIPRTEVEAIEERAGFEEVVEKFRETRYSRLPVYRESFDNIVGVLHNKDIMPFIHDPQNFDLGRVKRDAVFIPDTARLNDVLKSLQESSIHLAIVVDEHSGFEGILTLEDLLEEIVGEIQDEHDEALALKISKNKDGIVYLEGSTSIRDANRILGLGLPESDDYESVAGYLMWKAGKVLHKGDVVEHNAARFTVEKVVRHRIGRVKMEKVDLPVEVES